MRVSEIAELVQGVVEGPGEDCEITAVAPLETATRHQLSFLAHARYTSYLRQAEAGAILISRELNDGVAYPGPRIVVPDVHRALAAILTVLHPSPTVEPGVHPTAVLGEGAVVDADVTIGPYVVLGEGCRIGARTRIGANSVLGAGCVLGEEVSIHSQVTLYPGVRIGDRSILHSGVRVGVDGFGYAYDEGAHRKLPQVGACVIGRDVEIGANTTIDRGSVGATEIGDGVKIDNLVHIAHNVRIGANSIIIAQVGVAGSTRVGAGVTLAGQAGIAGHVQIGDGATIAGQAGVFGDVPAGQTYSGYPARPHRESLRSRAALGRLPELLRRLRTLEQKLPGGGEGSE